MATDHVKYQFFGLFTGLIVNVILAYFLIPRWGLPGAAVASLLNVIISTIICRHYLRTIIPIHIETKTVRDILISAGIMTVGVMSASIFLNQSLLTTGAMIGLGAIIYLSALFILNAQIREDIMKTLQIRWIA